MKTNSLFLSFLFPALLGSPAAHGLQTAIGQSLLPADDAASLTADPAASISSDDNAYADGVRAIDAGKWSDAIAIFSRVAAQGSSHAEGALYWKAYAENKQGQADTALDTCGALRHEHPGSTWIEECGALEIEIRARSGQPVPPGAEQSDELKLLALASLMQRDEKKALAQIDDILNSDASEKLKQGALFIMGEHHTDTVYPQIARLSFVDGDVRIERGRSARSKDITWEAAANGVPLESGYSIVTGDGRAEIEFENASVLYLAPNSVLTMNDLSTTAGIPHTDLGLMSGTATLHVHPYVAGETFILRTPTDNVLTKYPQTGYFRISSYTDGMALTPMSGGTLGVMSGLGPGQEDLTPGQTLYFKDNYRIMDAGPIHPPDFSGWDRWVSDRIAARTEATTEVLKASGLSAPVPGLADLNGKGYFFTCEPYGTCWEPLTSAPAHSQSSAPAETLSAARPDEVISNVVSQGSSTLPSTPGRNIRIIGSPAQSGVPSGSPDLDAFFPCIPNDVRAAFGILPAPAEFHVQPWSWAVCHSGSWIYQGNRYVWVVGRRHHRPCVHWIKSGRTVALVPIHPHDVKDHLPVNRKAPVLAVDVKNGRYLERLQLGNEHPIELLKEPPREFRTAFAMPLPRANEPHMEAHQLKDLAVAKATPGTPITFNAKSQNFMMPHQVMQGGHPISVVAPISNRSGDLQSHSGVFNGAIGSHGSFGGGYHGGASGGSFHGGGGGTVASGGASHGGATSSSASSGAAASSAGSSGGASSGGAHK